MSMRAALAAVLLLPLTPAAAAGQLISPGPLTEAHRELEGVRGCTACHVLGERGASEARCLECHDPVAARVRAGSGLHGSLADRSCGRCHKEHFGRDFDAIRLEEAGFDHAATGFRLTGAHAPVACRECHRAERVVDESVRRFGRPGHVGRTYLGVITTCAGCHAEADPHADQFGGRDCAECHAERRWDSAPRFDHGRTPYPLTGRHETVACAECHAPGAAGGVTRYTPLPHARCSSCHADPHARAFGNACMDCHRTEGWGRVDRTAVSRRFDHASTGFPLRGRHGRLECDACHRVPARSDEGIRIRLVAGLAGTAFPPLLASTCGDCHRDPHAAQFRGPGRGQDCAECHGETGWAPVSFDLGRHDDTAFPLTGAHLATLCRACHGPGAAAVDGGATATGTSFHVPAATCAACHREVDPHGGRFADASGKTACERCHGTADWRAATFDHSVVGPPGAGDGAACATCHATDDAHRDQFVGRDCGECHDTGAFTLAAFDHSRATFPLEAGHRGVACVACHPAAADGTGAYVRFRPLSARCEDCHGG